MEKVFTPLASAFALAIFLLVHVILQPTMASWRTDFTENRLYALSPGTKDILQNLAEPVELTFVYTRQVGQDYPAVRAHAQRVREILQTYESLGGKNLRINEIDPTPFSEEEDEAVAAGITAVQTDGTDPIYFGLIGRNMVDDERVIPFLAPERETTLEYDLTRMIARLDKPTPPTIGVITDLQNMRGNGEDNGYFILREMAALYDVEPIAEDFNRLPDDIDVLLIAHAAALNNWQHYLIDQFALRKGRLLIFVDPASKAAAAGGILNTGNRLARSDLGPFASAWGVRLSEDAVADVETALPINVEDNGRLITVGQPLFQGIPRAFMTDEDIITAPLSRTVNLGASGALTNTQTDGLTFTPLMTTGEAPSFIAADLAIRDSSPQDILGSYISSDSSLVLAGRLSGTLSSAFPNGPPAPETSEDPVLAELTRIGEADIDGHLTNSQINAQIIIIADTDLLDDGFYIDPRSGLPGADNASFVLNALETLSGSEALSNLRSRAPSDRPMVRINDMRDAAQAEFFDEQARLETNLATAQQRLEELQAVGATGGFFSGDLEAELTPEERAELAELRLQVVQTRARLRTIEGDFRRDIDGLESRLRFINIWGGPFIVVVLGLIIWVRRRRFFA